MGSSTAVAESNQRTRGRETSGAAPSSSSTFISVEISCLSQASRGEMSFNTEHERSPFIPIFTSLFYLFFFIPDSGGAASHS